MDPFANIMTPSAAIHLADFKRAVVSAVPGVENLILFGSRARGQMRDGNDYDVAAPAMARSAPSPVALSQIAAALGLRATQILAAQLLDNGPVWLGLLLDSPTTVLQLQPDHIALKHLGFKVGVAARYDAEPPGTPALIGKANREARAFMQNTPAAEPLGLAPDLEVRAFVDVIGVPEDPVTGSLNASLAQWLMADGILPERYTAAQGACLARAGLVYLARDAAGQVWVGGDVVTCIDGHVTL